MLWRLSLLATPLVKKRDRRGRWFLGPPGPPAIAYVRALGGDHLTDHRRGTHRLDHLLEPGRGAQGHYLAPDADSRSEARSRRPRRNCHGGRSEEACVRSDRFPSSYPTRLLGKRVFLLHGDAAVILARHLVADARHLVEIARVLERTVCFSPRDDLLGRARIHPLELHELGLARLVDVDLGLGGRRHLALALGLVGVGREYPARRSCAPHHSQHRCHPPERRHTRLPWRVCTAVTDSTPGRGGLTMPTIQDSATYLSRVRAIEALEVCVPLPGQERLLRVVAVLARGHHIAAHGATAPDQGHHVIESETMRSDLAPAVVTAAIRDTALPPSALPQLASHRLLAACALALGEEVPLSAHASSDAAESRRESSSHSFMSQATCCSASLRD